LLVEVVAGAQGARAHGVGRKVGQNLAKPLAKLFFGRQLVHPLTDAAENALCEHRR
jgi:hypothetical protein